MHYALCIYAFNATTSSQQTNIMSCNQQTTLSLEDDWVLRITNGHKVTRTEYERGCKKGENFVADVKRVVLYYTGNDKIESNVSVILKELLPEGSPQSLIMNCAVLFQNEIQAYCNVFPILLDKKVNEIIPVCYHTTNKSLIFEDLLPKGFKMADRQKGLNFQECSLVLEALAEFHHCSFKLKQTSPEQWNVLKRKFSEPLFCKPNKEKLLGTFWENSLKTSLEILNHSINPELIKVSDKLANFKGQLLETIQFLCQSEEKFSVLCHGDLWMNNVLFKYHNEPGFGPSDVKLLDFQCMRHASSSLDILHLLCSSTEINLIGTHYHDLIKVYYNKLSEKWSSVTFSLEELHGEIQKKLLFGIFISFMMIPCDNSAETSNEEDSLNIDYLKSELAIRNNLKYMRQSSKARIQQLIMDLLKLGMIYRIPGFEKK